LFSRVIGGRQEGSLSANGLAFELLDRGEISGLGLGFIGSFRLVAPKKSILKGGKKISSLAKGRRPFGGEVGKARGLVFFVWGGVDKKK